MKKNSDTQASQASQTTHAQSWWRLATWTSRKVNLGWWINAYNTPLLCISILIATAVLIARHFESLPTPLISISCIFVVLLLSSLLCWIIVRRNFESPQESLVRIEDNLKLDTSLTAANYGISKWPAPSLSQSVDLQWNLRRTILPSLLSIMMIVCAFFMPIGSHAQHQLSPPSPSALSELENKLEQLKNDEIIQEDYIQEIKEQVDEIKQQDPSEWFSHSTLEALDNLNDNHDAAASELEQQLNKAERALQSLQKHGDKLSETQKDNQLNEFSKAVENLKNGQMKPNQQLLEQLNQLDPNLLNQLTPEQLNQLRQNMRNMASKMKQQQIGESQENGDGDQLGENEGNDDGALKGQPGIGNGLGHPPEVLGDETNQLKTGQFEKIDPKSLENTLPGDLLETTDGEHDIDQTDSTIRRGGSTKHRGHGGERVWKHSLLPEEKKALKHFFNTK